MSIEVEESKKTYRAQMDALAALYVASIIVEVSLDDCEMDNSTIKKANKELLLGIRELATNYVKAGAEE